GGGGGTGPGAAGGAYWPPAGAAAVEIRHRPATCRLPGRRRERREATKGGAMSTVDYAGRHGYEAPSGDGQERLFDGNPARIFLQTLPPPSNLGLFGFMAATLMVGANMAGWSGDARTPSFLFPSAAVFGGIAQLAAGLWSYRARDALATAIHGAWGSFWIAYGILWLLVVTGNLTLPLPGQAFPALAFWFIGLAAITWSGALASLAESVAIFGVLSTLATASTIAPVFLFVGDEIWVKV